MNTKNNKTSLVKNYILSLIAQEQYSENGKLPSEHELCDRFKISRGPVNSALTDLEQKGLIRRVKGSGTFISKPPISRNGTNIIPFVVSEIKSAHRFLEAARGAEAYFKTQDCYLTINYCDDHTSNVQKLLQKLLDNGYNSVIMSSAPSDVSDLSYYRTLAKQGMKFTFVDIIPYGITGDLVSCNHVNGGYKATKHLIRNGYSRIAMLFDNSEISSVHDRIRGYIHALREANIPIRNEYLCPYLENTDPLFRPCLPKFSDTDAPYINDFHNTIYSIIKYLLSLPEPADALFCSNDIAAITAYNVCRDLNIRVPNQLAIIGFDNLPETDFLNLSSVEQPFYEIGYQAAQLCMERKHGLIPSGDRRLLLQPKIIARPSSSATDKGK